jgi:EAL domain-containing protein (putative c-di-GMP-specific phosphodiesterase class I)
MHAYNSRYGLQEGDKLLIAVGRALGDVFGDGLVCRSTDDHFLVIAPYHKEKTDETLRQINARVQQCVSGVSLGVRAGICEAKPHMPVMEVLDNAHTALKQIGTNLNVAYRLYSSDTEKKIMLAHQLVTTFEQALERHWIVPYYQPIMGVGSGKIAHAEALARWNDPVDGLLQPGQFIPALRNFHLLYKLDLSILRQVCHMLKSRLDEGKPVVPVSVNFSRQDFDRPDLVDMINEIVDTSHLDHRWICIEITEQDISEAPERMKSQIDAIHQSGYALWMDDFGSGYSSLNVMSEYPFDLIKFDQQLLMHLDEGHGANRYIMDAMAVIARKLGIHTLAEGVEKQSDYSFLKQIGCEYAQGYLFYHPMTADEFDTVLKGQK